MLVRCNHDEYRSVLGNSNEAGGKTGANEVKLKELLEQDLLRGQAGDSVDVVEVVLKSATRSISAVVHVVPISKKGTWSFFVVLRVHFGWCVAKLTLQHGSWRIERRG